MSSAVEICNEALLRVGAKTITSLDDNTTEAKVCKATYEAELQDLLDCYDWRFATVCIALAADVAEPVNPVYGYGYTLPSTVVRVLGADDGTGQYLIEWEREGDKVLCGIAGPLYLKVIQYIDDPAKFPPTFEGALSYCISSEIVMPLVNDKGLYQFLYQVADRKVKEAQNRDGGQGRAKQATANEITSARY
jgi:hypothetical protein